MHKRLKVGESYALEKTTKGERWKNTQLYIT